MLIICHCPLSTNKGCFLYIVIYLERLIFAKYFTFSISKNLKENMIKILSCHLPAEKKQGSEARFLVGEGGSCHCATFNGA